MRLLRWPSLRSATQNTFCQRAVAFTAMVLMVSVVLFWPNIRDHAGQALAQAQDNNYQPFQCGQAGNSNPQQRRQILPLKNGSGTGNAGGVAYPCVSGVQWHLTVGCTKCSASATSTGAGRVIGIINNAFSATGQTLYFAGTGSAGGLAQVAIQGLQFCSGANVPPLPSGNSGYGCTTPVNGIQLVADSSTSGSYNLSNDYALSITPNGPITVGGGGMMADVWGTGASEFEVPLNYVTSGSTGCGIVGGTSTTNGCTVNLSKFGGTLANALAGGTVMPLIGVNLTFYYLITHTPNVTNPYTEGAANNSVVLPNTRIYVGNGS